MLASLNSHIYTFGCKTPVEDREQVYKCFTKSKVDISVSSKFIFLKFNLQSLLPDTSNLRIVNVQTMKFYQII